METAPARPNPALGDEVPHPRPRKTDRHQVLAARRDRWCGMSKTAFDKIAKGLDEALAVARGQPGGATRHVPPVMDVRAVRARTGLSQDAFAVSFGFTVHQIRQWEQGRHPLGAMRAYLLTIERDYAVILSLLNGNQTAGPRM